MRIGKIEDSIKYYREAIKLNKDHGDAHRELGAALGLKGDSEGQLTELNKALEINSNDANAYFYQGSAYLALGKMNDAEIALKKCVDLDDKNGDAFRLLAGIQAGGGHFQEALGYADKAVAIDPGNKAFLKTQALIKKKATEQR